MTALPSDDPNDFASGCGLPNCPCHVPGPVCREWMGDVDGARWCPRCGWAKHLHDPNGRDGLDVFVPGLPAPQGSKRHVGGGRLLESSKAVAPWRTTVAWHAAQEFVGGPLDGALRVELAFVMPRPAATPKLVTPPAVKRPDLDKLCRAVFDALTGVIWRDDSQVVVVLASKRLAELDERPGARITVEPLSAPESPASAGGHTDHHRAAERPPTTRQGARTGTEGVR